MWCWEGRSNISLVALNRIAGTVETHSPCSGRSQKQQKQMLIRFHTKVFLPTCEENTAERQQSGFDFNP